MSYFKSLRSFLRSEKQPIRKNAKFRMRAIPAAEALEERCVPATLYWLGTTDGNWSGNNWATASGGAMVSGAVPSATNNTLIFDTTQANFKNVPASFVISNDIPSLTGLTITINDTSATNFNIGGNAIGLASGSTLSSTDIAGTGPTLSFGGTGITMAGALTITSNSGALTISAAIAEGANTLTVTAGSPTSGAVPGTVAITGNISGTGGIVTMNAGATMLTLGGTNTFTGGLNIQNGTVLATTSSGALGGATGAGTVTLGATGGSNAATLLVGTTGLNFLNPIALGTTTGILTIGNSGANVSTTFSGGVTGANNFTINESGAGGITFATNPINNSGTITNAGGTLATAAYATGGGGSGTTIISGGVGSNVSQIIQNSPISPLTISTTPLTVKSTGTTLTNSNTTGTAQLTVSGGITGTGNLILNNNSPIAGGITLSTNSVNNTGSITNSGTPTLSTTPSSTIISAVIGSNVTGVTQNSSNSQLNLSNANLYTGSTLISSGKLQVGNATALSSVSVGVTVSNGAALDLNGQTMTNTNALSLNGTGPSGGALINTSPTAATYAGLVTLAGNTTLLANYGNIILSNPGTITSAANNTLTLNGYATGNSIASIIGIGTSGVTVNGGTWTLSGASTYTGTTTVSNPGTLLWSGANSIPTSSANTLTVNTGANFSLADGAVQTTNTATRFNFANISDLTFDSNGTSVDKLTSSNVSNATTAGTIGIIINNTVPPTGAGGGTLISAVGGLSGATYYLANNTDYTASLTFSGTAVVLGAETAATPLTNVYWAGGKITTPTSVPAYMAYSNGTTSNWSTTDPGISYTATGLVPGATANVFFNTGETQQGSLILGANMTFNSVTFNDTNATAPSIGGGNSSNFLTLLSTGTGASSAISVNQNATINCPLVIGSNQTWNIAAGKTLTINGAISDPGNFSVTVTGGGTLILASGSNTFNGGLTVLNGIVQVNSAGALGANTNIITLGDSAGGNNPASLLIATNGQTFPNPIVLAPNTTGALTIGTTGSGISTTFSGGVTGPNNFIINESNGAGGNGTITFSTNFINNAGTVTNIGTSTGTTTISGGIGGNVTQITENSTTSALTISTNILFVNSGGTTLINNNASGSAVFTVNGGVGGTGNLVLTNNSSIANGISISGTAANQTINNVGTVTNTNNGTSTGSTSISASIGFNVLGVYQNSVSSALTISGNNNVYTYNGVTNFGLNIQAGTVIASNNAAALGAGQVTLGSASGSNPAAFLNASNGLTYAHPFVLVSGTTGTLTIGNTGSAISTTFAGGVTGANNLTINENSTTGTITFATGMINNAGKVTNISGGGTGATTITSIIGPNVTGVYQNSTASALNLSGANTFTYDGVTNFGLNILAGTVTASVSATSIGTGRVTIGNSTGTSPASLLIGTTNNLTFTNPIALPSNPTVGTLTIGTTGNITTSFSGGVTGPNNLTINQGGSGTITFTAANPISNAGTLTNTGTGAGPVVINANIDTNVLGVYQVGPNAPMTLAGANDTYTSSTNVSGGILTITDPNVFTNTSAINLTVLGTLNVNVANQSLAKLNSSTSGIVPAGTTLQYSQPQATATTGPGTIFGVVALNVTGVNPNYTLTFGTGGALTNLVTATYNSPIVLAGNASVISSSAVFTGGSNMTISSTTGGSTTLTLGGSNTGANVLQGVISDGTAGSSIAVVKTDAGNWSLNGANTYTGTTSFNGGLLTAGVAETAGTSGPFGKSAANNAGSLLFNGGTLQYAVPNASNDYSGRFSTAAGQFISVDTVSQTVTWATPLTSSGGALTKLGAGTLILTGTNSYTGMTSISAGTIQVGNAGGVGSLGSGTVNLMAGGANLTINRTGTVTVANFITGSGTFTQAGSGTTILTAANTFTGATTISAGILQLNHQLALWNSSVNVNIANGLQFGTGIGQFIIGALSGAGAVALQDLTSPTPLAITLVSGSANNNSDSTYSGILSGPGGLEKFGTGTLTLQPSTAETFTGGLQVQGGTLLLDNTLLATPTNLIPSGKTLTLSGGTISFKGKSSGTTTQSFSNVVVDGGGSWISGTSNGGTLNVTLGLITRANHSTLGFVLPALGSFGVSNVNINGIIGPWVTVGTSASATGATQYATINGSGNIAANTVFTSVTNLSLIGTDPTINYLVTGAVTGTIPDGAKANTLVLNFTGSFTRAGTLALNGYLAVSGTGVNTNSFPFVVGDSGEFVLNNGGKELDTVPITGTGAVTYVYTNTGGSATVLANGSTYTGATTIIGGEVWLPTTTNFEVGGVGGTGLGSSSNDASNLILNSGFLLSRANTYTDRLFTVTPAGGGVGIPFSRNGAPQFLNSGPIAYVGNGPRTLTIGAANTAQNPLLFAPVIGDSPTGPTSVVFTGGATSTYVLSGVNTFTGGSKIQGGVSLTLGNAAALGAGVTNENASQQLDLFGTSIASTNLLTLNGNGTNAGATTSGALLNSSGSPAAYNGPILLAAASTIVADRGALNISGTIGGVGFGLTLGGTGTANNTTWVSSVSTLASVIGTGSGSLTKRDAGTWLLSGANTYAGGTTISGGTLMLGSATALGAGAVTESSGAVLDLNGTTLTTNNALTLNGTGISTGGALINSSTTAATYAGAITLGSATSIMANNGNIILSSANALLGNNFGLTLGGAANGSISSSIASGIGSVTKTGPGTWTLSGANAYFGGTTVNAGTLLWSGANNLPATGALTINGGNFSLADGAARNVSTAALNLASSATLTFDWSGTGTAVDTLTSTAAATTVAGPVGIAINGINGLTNGSTGGTLISSPNGGLGNATYYLANNTNFTAVLSASATAVSIGSYTSVTAPSTFFWNGNKVAGTNAAGVDNAMAFSSGTASNWSTTQSNYTATGLVPGSAATIVFSDASPANEIAVLGADMSVGGVTINDSIPVTIGGSNALTIGSGGITLGASAADVTISANIVIGASQTWNIPAGKTLTISGTLSGSSSITLTINGGGTVVLAGSITSTWFGGTLAIGAGSVVTANVAQSVGSLTMAQGSILNIVGVNNRFNLTNPTGFNYIAGGTVTNSSSDLVIANTLNLGYLDNVGPTVISARIRGAGGLQHIAGVNTAVYLTSGNNTYLGGTNIGGGNVGVTNFTNNSLGDSSGFITFVGDGVLQWAANNTQDISGLQTSIPFYQTRLFVNSGVTAKFDTNGNNVTLNSSFGNNGSGAVRKIGAGTLTINNENTYTGGTTVAGGTLLWSTGITNYQINAGTLAVNAGGTASVADGTARTTTLRSTGTSLTLASGSVLAFDWNAAVLDQLSSAGTATASGNVGITINPTSPTGAGGTLIVAGAGSTLNNANYYLANNSNYTATLSKSATTLSIGTYNSAVALTTMYWYGNKLTGNSVAGADNALAFSTGSAANGNWSTTQATYTGTALIPGSTATMIFPDVQASVQSVVLGADMSVAGMTFNNTRPMTIGGSNVLTLGSTGVTFATNAGSPTINSNIVFGGGQTWTVPVGRTLTVTGSAAGSNGLTVAGPGTVVLSGNNSGWSNTLTINSGSTLRATASNSLITGTLNVNGTLDLRSDSSVSYVGPTSIVTNNGGTAGGVINVDRTFTGTAVNQNMTLPMLTNNANHQFYITGDHGYSLTTSYQNTDNNNNYIAAYVNLNLITFLPQKTLNPAPSGLTAPGGVTITAYTTTFGSGGGLQKNGSGLVNFAGPVNVSNQTLNSTAGQTNFNGTVTGTGSIAVSAGAIGGAGSIGVAVAVSGTGGINLVSGAVNALTITNNLSITGAAGANPLSFELASGGTTTDTITVTGNTSVTNAGAAVINLNQLGGVANPIAPGTYNLLSTTGTMAAIGQFALGTTKAFGQSFGLQLDGTGKILQAVIGAGTAGPATAYWGGGANNWSTAANWYTDASSGTPTGAVPGYQTNVNFQTTNPAAANLATTTIDADFDINSLNYSSAVTANTGINAGKMLTIEASNANGNVAGSGITVATPASGTPSNIITAKVGLASSQTWTVNTGGNLSVSGVISDFNAGYSLTKAGSGVLVLSGANTYSGGTVVNGGTLRLSTTANTIGGALTINSAGKVEYNVAGALSGDATNGRPITINGGTLDDTTTGATNHDYALSSVTMTGGTWSMTGSATGYVNLLPTLRPDMTITTLASGTTSVISANLGISSPIKPLITFETAANNTGIDLLLSGQLLPGLLSGVSNPAYGINKLGAGVMAITSNNNSGTFTGPVSIYAGTLQLGNGGLTGAINTASVISNNATLSFNRTNPLSQGTDFPLIMGTGNVVQAGSGTTTLNSANGYSGATIINAGALALGSAGTIGGSSGVSIAGGATFNVSAVSGGFVLAQPISAKGTGTANVTGGVTGGANTIDMQDGTNLGTLAFSAGLSSNAATYKFDVGAATSDSISIAGAASLTNMTINVAILSSATTLASSYTLIAAPAGGLVVGNFSLTGVTNPVTVSGGKQYIVGLSSDGTHLYLTATAVTQLVVTAQPASAAYGSSVTFTVEAHDDSNMLDPTFAGQVTVSVNTGTSGSVFVNSSTTTVTASGGVASFTLYLSPGTNVTLTASAVASTSAVSNSFTMSKRNITVSGSSANNKNYDGNTSATGQESSPALVAYPYTPPNAPTAGAVFGDNIDFDYTIMGQNPPTYAFQDAFVGAAKPITVAGFVLANPASTPTSYYNLIQPQYVTASILAVAPTVTSPTSASITASGATLGGNVTNDGGYASGSNITGRGIVYSTTNGFNPNTGTQVADTGAPFGTGTFTVPVTGLTASTTYYYVAYATNTAGSSYSAQGSFVTSGAATPTVASVTPFVGPTSGGITVVIVGTNFSSIDPGHLPDAVKFGAGMTFTNATSYTVTSNSQITAVAPAGAPSTVNVVVTNGSGSSADDSTSGTTGTANDYTFATPVVTSVVVNGGDIVARNVYNAAPALAGQQSVVEQLLVTFNQRVRLDANAFNISSLAASVTASVAIPSTEAVAVNSAPVLTTGNGTDGYTQYVLTFAAGNGVNSYNNGVSPGLGNAFTTIKDGLWQLNLTGANVHAGVSDTAANAVASKFWALYSAVNSQDVTVSTSIGDGNSKLLSDGVALGEMYATFGSFQNQAGPPSYNTPYDVNLDGIVDGIDLGKMYANFGTIWQF